MNGPMLILEQDASAVRKFCDEMENVPVGIIVGLFSAISQKLPAFSEWDTQKHHDLLNSNGAACAAMSEVREHVTKYGEYINAPAFLIKLTPSI